MTVMEKMLAPGDIDTMVRRLGNKEVGDLRIGAKIMEFREMFGIPRSTLIRATGIHETTVIRLELGQRMFSPYTLTAMLRGTRELVQLIAPSKMRAYRIWADELIDVVNVAEADRRIAKRVKRELESEETEAQPD